MHDHHGQTTTHTGAAPAAPTLGQLWRGATCFRVVRRRHGERPFIALLRDALGEGALWVAGWRTAAAARRAMRARGLIEVSVAPVSALPPAPPAAYYVVVDTIAIPGDAAAWTWTARVAANHLPLAWGGCEASPEAAVADAEAEMARRHPGAVRVTCGVGGERRAA